MQIVVMNVKVLCISNSLSVFDAVVPKKASSLFIVFLREYSILDIEQS